MLEIEAIRSRPRRTTLRAVVWTLAYVALVSMPVLVLASGLGGMPGSGWGFDFSMGLGFGALAVMGGQFVLTARFRRATAPIGMDVVYVFHRWLAVVGLALVLAHYALLRWHYPATLAPASPASAPFYMTAGRLALAVFAALIVSSLWRKRFGIEYGGWRIAHGVMALAGMVLAIIHVRGVGYYSGVFWSRVVIDAFLGSLVAIVVYVRLVKPLLVASRTYRVTAVRSERGHAHTLSIEPEGHAGLRFAPGQFGWLSLGVGPWRAREHPSRPPTARSGRACSSSRSRPWATLPRRSGRPRSGRSPTWTVRTGSFLWTTTGTRPASSSWPAAWASRRS